MTTIGCRYLKNKVNKTVNFLLSLNLPIEFPETLTFYSARKFIITGA